MELCAVKEWLKTQWKAWRNVPSMVRCSVACQPGELMLLTAVISYWHARRVIIQGHFPAVYSVIIMRNINPLGYLSADCYHSSLANPIHNPGQIITMQSESPNLLKKEKNGHVDRNYSQLLSLDCVNAFEKWIIYTQHGWQKKRESPDNYFPLPELWIAAVEEIILKASSNVWHSGS